MNDVVEFSVWKTVKLGTGCKTADDFRLELGKAECKIDDFANDIMDSPGFMVATNETEINLVIVSLPKLGFLKGGLDNKDVYERALKLGLRLCPAEVGPQLRLQYKNQPVGESLRIAMEPIFDNECDLGLFVVEHISANKNDPTGLWLSTCYDFLPEDYSFEEIRWVFCLP